MKFKCETKGIVALLRNVEGFQYNSLSSSKDFSVRRLIVEVDELYIKITVVSTRSP